MKEIKPLEVTSDGDYMSNNVMFLAGGISDCPDWQATFVEALKDLDTLVVYNPRRDSFNINDINEHISQIEWEFNALNEADFIVFWFPEETVCPITLLELGKYMVSGITLLVGCHPNYIRRFDVQKQLSLEYGEDVYVSDSLEDLIKRTIKYVRDDYTGNGT